jgi:hypothetical protein
MDAHQGRGAGGAKARRGHRIGGATQTRKPGRDAEPASWRLVVGMGPTMQSPGGGAGLRRSGTGSLEAAWSGGAATDGGGRGRGEDWIDGMKAAVVLCG